MFKRVLEHNPRIIALETFVLKRGSADSFREGIDVQRVSGARHKQAAIPACLLWPPNDDLAPYFA